MNYAWSICCASGWCSSDLFAYGSWGVCCSGSGGSVVAFCLVTWRLVILVHWIYLESWAPSRNLVGFLLPDFLIVGGSTHHFVSPYLVSFRCWHAFECEEMNAQHSLWWLWQSMTSSGWYCFCLGPAYESGNFLEICWRFLSCCF